MTRTGFIASLRAQRAGKLCPIDGGSEMVPPSSRRNHEAAREKLRRLFDLEVENIRRAKSVLEDGNFASANGFYQDEIDRYLASPNDGR